MKAINKLEDLVGLELSCFEMAGDHAGDALILFSSGECLEVLKLNIPERGCVVTFDRDPEPGFVNSFDGFADSIRESIGATVTSAYAVELSSNGVDIDSIVIEFSCGNSAKLNVRHAITTEDGLYFPVRLFHVGQLCRFKSLA